MVKILFWLALTVYHEARGESDIGQRAVVKVILNRAKAKGWAVEDVVKARKQFSCFNNGLKDPAVWIKDMAAFLHAMENFQAAQTEWLAGDTLHGATHYYALQGMVRGKPPYWAASMTFVADIGHHRSLKEG
ncbi:MAG: cell wall hydrolase [Desulfocapsaceae bacterium]|nr:cell wall hydrolase [Desulfocapsaceae bacterium]